VPTTPDQWLAAIERTTRRDQGIFGLVATSIEHPNLVAEAGTWVCGEGLDWTRDGRWDFRNPAVVAGIEQYRRSMRFAPPGQNSNVARQLLIDGKATFLRDGPGCGRRSPRRRRRCARVSRSRACPSPRHRRLVQRPAHAGAPRAREAGPGVAVHAADRDPALAGAVHDPLRRTRRAHRLGHAETIRRLPHLQLIQDSAATARSTFGSAPAVRENYNEFATIFGRAMMRLISTQDPTDAVLAALDRDLQRAIPLGS
jgi:hypothetical protein